MPSTIPRTTVTSDSKIKLVINWSDPRQICRLLDCIENNTKWRQVCFPGSNTDIPGAYKMYVDIFLHFCQDDRAYPAMKTAEKAGLVKKAKMVTGGKDHMAKGNGKKENKKMKWVATPMFGSKVINPIKTKISALKSTLREGKYSNVHGFDSSWKSWEDVPTDIRGKLENAHPYYFQLLRLSGMPTPQVVVHKLSADTKMPRSTEKAATENTKRLVIACWDTDPEEVSRLLKIIKREPLWREACFSKNNSSIPHLNGVYIDIFLSFYRHHTVMTNAEEQGLVRRIERDDGEKEWVPTKSFHGKVGNPVKAKIASLKREFKAGMYTKEHGFDPSWKKWQDVPKRQRADLRAAHPHYFRLLELVEIHWSTDPSEVTRLLKLIKGQPTMAPRNDPAIKAAEREGLVQRVKGSGAKSKWEATERFRSRVGNPVARQIESLKSTLKSGTYTSTHNFRPSWKRWGDVPNDIRATLQTERPYYCQLLELAQSSFEFNNPKHYPCASSEHKVAEAAMVMTVRLTALRLAKQHASLHKSFPFSGHRRTVIEIATSPTLRPYSSVSDPRNAPVTSISPPEYTVVPDLSIKNPSKSNALVQRMHDSQSIKACHPVFEAVLERFRYWHKLDTGDAETIELVVRENELHYYSIVEALLFKYEANTVGLTIGSGKYLSGSAKRTRPVILRNNSKHLSEHKVAEASMVMTVRLTALRLAKQYASLHKSFPFSGHRGSVIAIATSPTLRLYSSVTDPRNAPITSTPPPEYTWVPAPLMKRPSNSNALVQRMHDPQSIKACHPVFGMSFRSLQAAFSLIVYLNRSASTML
ncbi:hypothetical protein B9479_006647 [Cryptococcus floricola]|uniref:Uncharacterized protein n=1 Tax=Cryptococcus floricola TaxID=2591691 RepID=A0A5D3AR73_9TREE|nr:hypothetical protein B9479_006647 [Cryptococcus floricola]